MEPLIQEVESRTTPDRSLWVSMKRSPVLKNTPSLRPIFRTVRDGLRLVRLLVVYEVPRVYLPNYERSWPEFQVEKGYELRLK